MANSKSITRRLREFSSASRFELEPSDLVENLRNESDRAFIVVSGSLAEDRLRSHLFLYLAKIGGDPEAVSAKDGPHAMSFGGLIHFARTIGYLSSELVERINAIRRLRNAAAHSIKPVKFTTPLIREAALEIVAPSSPRHASTLRYAFGARCSVVGFDEAEDVLWSDFVKQVPALDNIADKLKIPKRDDARN